MTDQKPGALGWGLIGIGAIADKSIAPAITAATNSRLAAVCSRSSERAQAFAEKHAAKASYDDYADMLADPAVDMVYIASPNALHTEHTIAALEHGKHVLVEKPMTLEVSDARAVVRAAAERDLRLGVGFHLRHKATAIAARAAIEAGQLGRPFYADFAVGAGKGLYPYDTWRADPGQSGGGSLLHQGVHALDLAAYLCGVPIVEVTCMTDAATAEEVFAGTCRLADDTLVNVASHSRRAGTRPDWTVFGTGGWLDARGGTSPAAGDTVDLYGDGEVRRLATSTEIAYADEVVAFADAVIGHADPNGDGRDGLRAVAVSDALYRSAAERRTVTVEPVD